MVGQRCAAWVTRLPSTALPVDLQRWIRPCEADSVRFLRTPLLLPSGAAVLRFTSEARAQTWSSTTPPARLGGEEIRTKTIELSDADRWEKEHYAGFAPELVTAIDIAAAQPMQTVLLSNLPLQTTAEKLEKKLGRSYALNTSTPQCMWPVSRLVGAPTPSAVPAVWKLPPVHPDSTSAWFLVRLQTSSEALRL
ncbi:hypothetical protein MCAP1_001499 [Malassezia caprae]|uniref:Uncharacterized protein n=1 Tax=Malassezia caprae TaxID=1381934 RepID=A0AAF0E9N9_9BASI|nr:hypothetical protein MCAP1_001499 [Malassezia caprae]